MDAEKNLQPLLNPLPPVASREGRVIVIDPGHGGENGGTKSVLSQGVEKEYTLDWALRLREELVKAGWTVYLTRKDDQDLSLTDRVAFAERFNADLFISLHFNSATPNREPSGIETYCLTPVGLPSSLVRESRDDIGLAFPNNAHDLENFQYAVRLHRALITATHAADRGVKRARFMAVLLGQNRPAVLIEGGFLSNPEEARRIATAAYRQKLAEAVAQALQ
jgi:N-acetylmuramoyl-L-alanine amidase